MNRNPLTITIYAYHNPEYVILFASSLIYDKILPYMNLAELNAKHFKLARIWLVPYIKVPMLLDFLEAFYDVDDTPTYEKYTPIKSSVCAPVHFINWQEFRLLNILNDPAKYREKLVLSTSWEPIPENHESKRTAKIPMYICKYRISSQHTGFLSGSILDKDIDEMIPLQQDIELRYLVGKGVEIKRGDIKRYSFISPLRLSNRGVHIYDGTSFIPLHKGNLPKQFKCPIMYPITYFDFPGGINRTTSLGAIVHPDFTDAKIVFTGKVVDPPAPLMRLSKNKYIAVVDVNYPGGFSLKLYFISKDVYVEPTYDNVKSTMRDHNTVYYANSLAMWTFIMTTEAALPPKLKHGNIIVDGSKLILSRR